MQMYESLYDSISSKAKSLIDRAAYVVAESGSGARKALTDFGFPLVADFMRLAQEEGNGGEIVGSLKKEAVLKLAGDFYDRVIEPIDLPGPDVIIDPLLRATWLHVVDYAIDGLASLFKSTGVSSVVETFQSRE